MPDIGEQCRRLTATIDRATGGSPADVQQALGGLRSAAEALATKAEPFDQGSSTAPERITQGVAMVAANTTDVVETQRDGLSSGTAPYLRTVETGTRAIKVAGLALDLAGSLAAAERTGASPPYATTSINDEIIGVKTRLAEDRDRAINGLQVAVLSEFLECLQRYAADQGGNIIGHDTLSMMSSMSLGSGGPSTASSSNNNLEPPTEEVQPRVSTTIEDFHNGQQPPGLPIPAYSAMDLPSAPHRIHLRHVSRLAGLEREPVDLVFDPQHRTMRIAMADFTYKVRFFTVRGQVTPDDPVAKAVGTISLGLAGRYLTMAPAGLTRVALMTENDAGDTHPQFRHDGEHYKKSMLAILDTVKGDFILTIRRQGVRPFSWSPDGSMLAVKGLRGRVEVVNAVGQGVAVVRGHTDEVVDAKFTSDGGSLVTISRDGTLRVTSTSTWQGTAKLEMAEWRNPLFLAVPVTQSRIIVSVWGRKVYLWHPDTGALQSWSLCQGDGTTGSESEEGWPMAASPDLKYLCCRTEGGADVREVATGRVLCRMGFGAGFASSAAWSPDSRTLAVGRMVGGVFGYGTGRVDFWEVVD